MIKLRVSKFKLKMVGDDNIFSNKDGSFKVIIDNKKYNVSTNGTFWLIESNKGE